MCILLLDELFSARDASLWNSVRDLHELVVIEDPSFDLERVPKRDTVEVVALSSTFFGWRMPVSMLDLFPRAKGLCISGGWHEHIDLGSCQRRGITVTCVPDFASLASAEWCLMVTLMLARRVPLLQQNPLLAPPLSAGRELAGKRAGIVGMGGVGREIARLATAVGMECVYWSRKSRNKLYEYSELEEVLKTSDCVFLTFYEARNMAGFIGREKLTLLKSSAILVSGLGSQPGLKSECVDWPTAIEMVQRGDLGGLAIEAGEGESVPSVKGNVYVAPGHTGWCTTESIRRGTIIWIKNVLGIYDSTSPNVLNKAAGDVTEGH